MMDEMDRFDVLGLGAVAIDDLLYVASYPPADAKASVLRRERQCGGLTGTALVTAAGSGRAARMRECWGRTSSPSRVANFVREGVDVSHLLRREGARPIRSTIIIGVDEGTRNVFSDRQGFVGPDPLGPEPELILRDARPDRRPPGRRGGDPGGPARPRGGHPGGCRLRAGLVAGLSRSARPGRPPADRPRLRVRACQGDPTRARPPGRLWHGGRSVVVVTCGAEGCWAVDGPDDGSLRHQPAFSVAAVDTTGCGDVFHGAYASALARGADLDDRLTFASAAAALKAMRPGGRPASPTWPPSRPS